MIYELWGLELRNLLAEFEDESAGLAFVRELLEDGWSPDDLSLGPPPSRDGASPPVLTGTALAERALATPPQAADPSRSPERRLA